METRHIFPRKKFGIQYYDWKHQDPGLFTIYLQQLVLEGMNHLPNGMVRSV